MSNKTKRNRRNKQIVNPAIPRLPIPLARQGVGSKVLLELADDRVAEARALDASGHYSGCAYLAGYAIELLLKAIIVSRDHAGYWAHDTILGEYRTHNLDVLLKGSGLKERLRAEASTNIDLGYHWQTVRNWGTHFRYMRLQKRFAQDTLHAVVSRPNGVAAWLRSRLLG